MDEIGWSRFYVEIYDEAGYQGTWEVGPAEGRLSLDEADRDALRAQLEADPQFAGAEIVLKPAEDGLTFGILQPGASADGTQNGRDTSPRPARSVRRK